MSGGPQAKARPDLEARLFFDFLRWALCVCTLTMLAACGGGGSDSDDEDAPTADLEATAPGSVTLAGDVTFDSVPSRSGALDYAAVSRRPVRGARVEVLRAGTSTVLASGATSSRGRYSLKVPPNTRVAVRVWARTVRSSGVGRWDVAVRDNTRDGARYSMQTGAFTTGTTTLERDVHAKAGWSASTRSYTGTRVAAPFAILDTVYAAMAKVRSVDADAEFPRLALYWSPRNVPASGDAAEGEIGTSHFEPSTNSIYLLGLADVDTDEYDASVVAHEWGHYYQSAFSRDDSLGGPHSGGMRLDRTVAFSEGWGNAWSGIALNRSTYSDSADFGQAAGFSFRLDRDVEGRPGWFNESSVQTVLWKLDKAVGFEPIHLAMTGRLRRSAAVTSMHSFAASLGAASSSAASLMKALLEEQDISTATNDPYGRLETNDGGLSLALPLYYVGRPGALPSGICVSHQLGSYNQLGNNVYVRLTGMEAGDYSITVRGPTGSDPDVVVRQAKVLALGDGLGRTEALTARGVARGDVVLRINDYNESASRVCFTVAVTRTGSAD